MPDLAAIKHRQQQAWATGDDTVIGAATVIVSELLCEAVDLQAGDRVLDVATGSGNTALAAARRSAAVTGLDYVAALVARGQARAAAERLHVMFHVGDAEHLPSPDAAFNPTASVNSLSNVLVLKGVITSRSWLTSGTLRWSWDPRPPSPQGMELSAMKFGAENYFLLHKLFQ